MKKKNTETNRAAATRAAVARNKPDPDVLRYEAGYAAATQEIIAFLRVQAGTLRSRSLERAKALDYAADMLETGEWLNKGKVS